MSDTLSPESEPSYISIPASEYARLVKAEEKLKYAIDLLTDSVGDPMEMYGIKVISADATQVLLNHIKS